jgi:hypothetical protein
MAAVASDVKEKGSFDGILTALCACKSCSIIKRFAT